MPRKIRDSVVVITGASSGIGRATALAFATRGASLVLAARREEALDEVATQCQNLGGRALAVPTDVTDEAAVQRLAQSAVENFGRLDVWVNNAAVTMYARFEETPLDAFRRVVETNLFGYVYGVRAALPYFREQGGGVLINVGSVSGVVGETYASAYSASKFAVRGLSTSLRQEIQDPGIHICTILPASIDTPFFQHGANYTGRGIKPLPPIYDATAVVQAIVDCVEDPQSEVIVGTAGRAIAWLHAISPSLAEWVMAFHGKRERFTRVPASPTSGNLFEPMPQWTGVSGGWKAHKEVPAGSMALVGMGALAGVILLWSWRRGQGVKK